MSLKEISNFELFTNEQIVDYLRTISCSVITPQNENEIIGLLDKLLIYIPYCKNVDFFPEIFRITINKNITQENKRLQKISNLKYPPKKFVKKYGRCNLPGQSILYASLMQGTSLNELKPRKGDLITKSKWVLKSERPLVYIPIFSNQPTNEPYISETGEIIPKLANLRTLEIFQIFKQHIQQYPQNLRKLSEVVMQFIADFFSQRIATNNHLDYLFSAYFSNKFLNVIENGNIDAIYYPSVPDKLNSENLAIKPAIFDELYKLSEVNESLVTEDPSNGRERYRMNATGHSKDFNFEKDEINWPNKCNF